MKHFAELFWSLDASTSTSAKVEALSAYFLRTPPADAAWAVYFLAGGKPKQTVPTKVLRAAVLKASGLTEWLFEESYQAVGDLAETIAHLLPAPSSRSADGLATWIEQRLLPLRGQSPEEIETQLIAFWDDLEVAERFLFNKLITGGFRVGVSKLLVTRGLSEATKIDKKILSQRLMGYTDASIQPTAARYEALVDISEQATHQQSTGQPYPFFLAHQWVGNPASLGDVSQWQVEWKWDGIRAQLVKREGQVFIWSRGEELITDRFPEIVAFAKSIPDGTVLDGELLAWNAEQHTPLAFAKLQQRIGRKSLTARILRDIPAAFVAYDLLEVNGEDCRHASQAIRRQSLEQLAKKVSELKLSEVIHQTSWSDLASLREVSRSRGVEGFMLKSSSAAYGVGRTKADGVWWKWKIDPLSIDCVMIYAQRGHGRRASLYTDYTFAVWQDEHLVPFAKAYSGLTDAEFKRVDEVIRKTTIEKFGPVRSVKPTLVFELGFEGIQASPRHKSGIAVRFPRILRWREDKTIEQADTLENLKQLMVS